MALPYESPRQTDPQPEPVILTPSQQKAPSPELGPVQVTVTPGTAFKAGFFGAFGVLAAWIVAFLAVGIVGYLGALLIAAMFFS